MIPEFEDGLLPPGVHGATWNELLDAFGWNPERVRLLAGLRLVIGDLRAVGCRRVWLNGSFVTEKDVPEDYELCWHMEGVDLENLNPILLDFNPPRILQKAFYGGEVVPNVTEFDSGQPFVDFFQQDAESGKAKGILQIDLGEKRP